MADRRRFGKALRSGGAGSTGPEHAGYFSADDPLATTSGEPVDMAQVRADDAFIEALANASRTAGSAEFDPLDERMASLLLSWRDDVNAEAAGPLVDLDTAAAAIKAAPRPSGRQLFGPLAAAAAVLVIAFTGVGLVARDAAPGTPLFGVTKVLYSEKAKSVEAAAAVRTKLEAATDALESGRVADARVAVEEAQEQLPVVQAEDGQGDLVARTEQIIAELERRTPTSPVPPPTSTSSPAASTTNPATSATSPAPLPENPVVTSTPTPPSPTEPTEPEGPASTSTAGPTDTQQVGAPGDGTSPGEQPGELPGGTTDGTPDGTESAEQTGQ